MRVLVINVVESWASSDSSLYWQARRALQVIHDHAHRPEHNNREAKEDHRAFAADVMDRVVAISSSGANSHLVRKSVEDLMLLLFHTQIVDSFWRDEKMALLLKHFEGFLNIPGANASTP
jgi:hypothetical protein